MKLGCLPYLNVKPLVYPLEHGCLPNDWELIYAPPSKLAQMLANDEITAAPVSSFATFINPELEICPGICIAADGPVVSVLLLSKEKISNTDIVGLDASSISGANMLKIILEEAYNVRPQFLKLPPIPVSEMLNLCDAAMVIGNPAMQYRKDGLFVLDLAEEWKKLTGLPAVFAVWAGKKITPELADTLQKAKEIGLTKLEEIADEESKKLGFPYEFCLEYLSKIIVYDLGQREIQSLELFRDKAIAHGLVEITAPSALSRFA